MNKLITMAIESGQASYIFRVPQVLLTELESKIADWVRSYIVTYGVTPSMARLTTEFKFFVPESSTDPIDDVFATELSMRKNIYVRTKFAEHQGDLLKGVDPTELILSLAKAVNTVDGGITTTASYDRTAYFNTRVIYDFGVNFIDKTTGGIAGGDLVWIVGRPGSNKTTFAEWLITTWALEGKRVLYVSNENMAEDVIQKLDAFYGGWNPMCLRTGEWSAEDRLRVAAVATLLSKLDGIIVVPNEAALSTSDVMALIDTHKPDIVLIDGVYLMSESKKAVIGWEDAAAVSRALKRLARKTGLPFIGVIQANREAEGENVGRGTIAHTDAYLQDADLIIALNRQDGGGVLGQIIKTRWGVTDLTQSFSMRVDFESMQISFTSDIAAEVSEEDW